jgi:hypothetical protein
MPEAGGRLAAGGRTRAFSGHTASERSERAAAVPGRSKTAPLRSCWASRTGASPRRLDLLESVWGARRWRPHNRAVGGGRTAGRERSAGVEQPGSGGAALPDQASNAGGPVRAAVRRGRAARPRRKGIAGVRAPAVRRRSAPAAERTRAATWRTGERRRLRSIQRGRSPSALASPALWQANHG